MPCLGKQGGAGRTWLFGPHEPGLGQWEHVMHPFLQLAIRSNPVRCLLVVCEMWRLLLLPTALALRDERLHADLDLEAGLLTRERMA